MSIPVKIQKVVSPLYYYSSFYQQHWKKYAEKHPFTIVLAYHRVVENQKFPDGRFGIEKGITASTFEAQIRFMLKHFTPVKASQAQQLTSDRIQFAITLDDGYEDNYKVAAPILKKLGVSATFFVVGDYIGTDKLFWWEQLAEMMRATQVAEIDLLKLGLHEHPLPHVLPVKTPDDRQFAYEQLSRIIRSGLHINVTQHMTSLTQALETEASQHGREYGLMDWQQLQQLVQQGFEIGGHTASHCNVVGAKPGMLEEEVIAPITLLETELQTPVRSFAYPYGHYEENRNTTAEILSRTNCRAAFTTVKGVVKQQSDAFELPRTTLNRQYPFACAFNVQETINADRKNFPA